MWSPEPFCISGEERNLLAVSVIKPRFISIPVFLLVTMPTELCRLRTKKKCNHKTYFSNLILFSHFAFNDFHLRSSLFCDVTHRRSIVSYRHFGTNFRSHLQGSAAFQVSCKQDTWTLKMGRKCPETSLTTTWRNSPKERSVIYTVPDAWNHAQFLLTMDYFRNTEHYRVGCLGWVS